MRRLPLLWPMIIITSSVLADIVVDGGLDAPVRPWLVMWFLLVCPGMTVVRFLHFDELVIEWTLALATSVSIDALVASAWLYAGNWSPTGIFDMLAVFCLIGAVVQFTLARSHSAFTLARGG